MQRTMPNTSEWGGAGGAPGRSPGAQTAVPAPPAGVADLRTRVLADRDVLAALADGSGGAPAFAAEVARRLGIPEDQVPLRLASLVTLGYVEQLMAGKDGGYTLTARGLAAADGPPAAGRPT
jgi:hypothetical protein